MPTLDDLNVQRLLEGEIAPGPAPVIAPPEVVIINGIAQVRERMIEAATSARRLISVLTYDMDPQLFDQPAFLEAMKRFVLGRAFGKARLLVRDTAKMNASYNRFVAMARRLSGSLEIRSLHPEHRSIEGAYLIADRQTIVYRERHNAWQGVFSRNNPELLQERLAAFDAAWIASDNPQARVSNL